MQKTRRHSAFVQIIYDGLPCQIGNVGDDHLGSLGSERLGGCLADPGCAAGDDDHLSSKSRHLACLSNGSSDERTREIALAEISHFPLHMLDAHMVASVVSSVIAVHWH